MSVILNSTPDTTTTPKEWPSLSRNEITLKCKYVARTSQLGDGNFSVVKECMNVHTKELYAMKLVHKHLVKNKIQLIQREFDLLKTLSDKIRSIEENATLSIDSTDVFQGHHHILQLFDFFETKKSIVLITQLCQQKDLYEMIIDTQHLDLNKQVMPYAACLLSALEFLHDENVVHRDIKAENILFRLNKDIEKPKSLDSDYDVSAHDLIIGDFGLATNLNASKNSLKEYVGTVSYISPEIVACKGIGTFSQDQIDKITPYGFPVDIWALGVLTYFMALGYTPFDCETDDETIDCIKKCDYYIDEDVLNDSKYQEFWSFLQCCFIVDPFKRRTAKQLKSHPFVKKYFTNDISTTDFTPFKPMLKKHKSFSSLHVLKRPPPPIRKDSLITLSNNSASQLGTFFNTNDSSTQTTPLNNSKVDIPLMLSTRDKSINKIRETLRKTLSTTNLPNHNRVTKSQPPSSAASNSTFFLDPQPPSNFLMNGGFCDTPESLSNFSTTPRSSLSRNSSYKNLSRSSSLTNIKFNLVSSANNDNDNNHHRVRDTERPKFDFFFGDDE
ncbi:hypothetical protein KAFR_0B01510 [Kazachstania africana CBS 2517]|uniref:Protein kinase domain-containing protein n=1 Tax=Kazachstania africana (strain ATCC 22294 / BCRC 22015 / CBS 2517 / CECT 1963 / NBRC 1671 / NRRL Y-8276) TaxID=1071382 RepID=H2AQ00_KAZAF|nr:hypothetical protein KAFR_0B01510 [Kazachstania africana CBS 2517]CCF56450.1 hypothetical protein KAFR_0B01510 [Kazachstania africana CBS 2517]